MQLSHAFNQAWQKGQDPRCLWTLDPGTRPAWELFLYCFLYFPSQCGVLRCTVNLFPENVSAVGCWNLLLFVEYWMTEEWMNEWMIQWEDHCTSVLFLLTCCVTLGISGLQSSYLCSRALPPLHYTNAAIHVELALSDHCMQSVALQEIWEDPRNFVSGMSWACCIDVLFSLGGRCGS